MKFKENRVFATPEAAERKLLELANAIEPDHAGRLSVAVLNMQFAGAGGSSEDYGSAVKAAIAPGWLTMHPSGAFVSFTQAGATCSRNRQMAKFVAMSVAFGLNGPSWRWS